MLNLIGTIPFHMSVSITNNNNNNNNSNNNNNNNKKYAKSFPNIVNKKY